MSFWDGFEKRANLAKMIAGLPSRRQLSVGAAKSMAPKLAPAAAAPIAQAAKPVAQGMSLHGQNAVKNITTKRYADIK